MACVRPQWLRLHYMTPVTVYYKLTVPFVPAGSYLGVGQHEQAKRVGEP